MDTTRDRITHCNSNAIHVFQKLSVEVTVFNKRFTPIGLEYLIHRKGSDPALEMIIQSLKLGA